MSSPHQYTTLILDLGDVLFRWSPKTKTTITSRQLKDILSCTTWFEYERGRISQTDCYDRVGKEFSVDPSVVADAFQQARDSLQPNEDFLSLVRELKIQARGQLRVFALSNISLPDYEYIIKLPTDWSVFDKVFPSALIGERKPHLGAFRRVISELGIDPHTTVFVDDRVDNVLSARSLGMHGIVFDKEEEVFRALRNVFGEPVSRGRDYLRRGAGSLESMTDAGVVFEENFTQLLILEATRDRSLIKISECPRTWNFFRGKPLFSEEFPDDLDTTSVALTVLQQDGELVSSIMDDMAKCVDSDGIIQTYFDRSRPRMDPFVCVNVLSLFYSHGRGSELPNTLDWVHEVLFHRAYIGGSRYYPSADCFLYFMSRLLSCTQDADMQSRLRPLFVERITERVGVEGNPLELAFRLLACASVGISNDRDLQTLLAAQCADGGWETCWFYRFGSTGVKAGNRGLTTALAVCTIEAAQRRPPSPSPSAKLEVSGFFSKLSRPSSFRSLRLPWRWTQPTEVAC